MPRKMKKPPEGKRIEKTEDKAWSQWFKGLSEKDHEGYLAKLGLDKEEIDEWEEDVQDIKKDKKKAGKFEESEEEK
jgi:hypothetical protein